MTWDGARIWCEQMGQNSHLVKIETKEENNYLMKEFGGHNSWIGANDLENEGKFQWVDQSPVVFSGWAEGEPNGGGNENCVHLYKLKNDAWNDWKCYYRSFFICER